jgi:hypothetical protein
VSREFLCYIITIMGTNITGNKLKLQPSRFVALIAERPTPTEPSCAAHVQRRTMCCSKSKLLSRYCGVGSELIRWVDAPMQGHCGMKQ